MAVALPCALFEFDGRDFFPPSAGLLHEAFTRLDCDWSSLLEECSELWAGMQHVRSSDVLQLIQPLQDVLWNLSKNKRLSEFGKSSALQCLQHQVVMAALNYSDTSWVFEV